MINSTAFDYVNVLTKAADASYQREAILANNISNVDTPGYKRKDLNFEGVLSQELGRCKHQSLDKKISELDTSLTKTDKTDSFSDVLSAAMGSIGETNDLQNAAEQEEVRFALGESDNTHDLLVAETKAAVALQYTVAVRDKIIDAYKELMQMSI